MPALASIPFVNSLNDRGTGISGLLSRWKGAATGKTMQMADLREQWLRMDHDGQQNSALCEAVLSLRTSVLLCTPERSLRSSLTSSAELGGGKITIAANLAISLAQVGKRTLFVDGDMRHPCVHKHYIPADALFFSDLGPVVLCKAESKSSTTSPRSSKISC